MITTDRRPRPSPSRRPEALSRRGHAIDLGPARRRPRPRQVHAVDQPPHPGARPQHPALQGHRRLQGRPQALRLPGRAHDARRRAAARLEAGREARVEGRVHRPRPRRRRRSARVSSPAPPDRPSADRRRHGRTDFLADRPRLRPLDAGAPAVAAAFIGGAPALALADGIVRASASRGRAARRRPPRRRDPRRGARRRQRC